MELSHRVVIDLSAQVQRQTNKTASEMLSSCLKFKSLPSLKLFNKPITTIRLYKCINSDNRMVRKTLEYDFHTKLNSIARLSMDYWLDVSEIKKTRLWNYGMAIKMVPEILLP